MTNDHEWWKKSLFMPGAAYRVDQSVTSYNQSGGITAHTVNMAPPPRQLDEHGRAQLLQMIPRDRTVEVAAENHPEPVQLAQQVWQFMAASGFKMGAGLSYRMSFPATVGLHVDLNSNPEIAQIVIGLREA